MPDITPEQAAKVLEMRKSKQPTPEQASQALAQRMQQRQPYASDVPVGTENLESMRKPQPQMMQQRNQQPMSGSIFPSAFNDNAMVKAMNQNPVIQSISENTQGIRGAGDAISNLMGKGMQSLSKPYMKMTGQEYTPASPMKTGKGTAYNIGSVVGPTALAAATLPASGPEAILASGSAGSFFNPEDPFGGLLEGLAFGAGGESVSKAASATAPYAKSGLDKLVRTKEIEQLMEKIASQYEIASEQAWGVVKPLFDKYGDKSISPKLAKKIDSEFSAKESYITPDIQKLKNEFDNNPTPKTLQDLQSQIGFEIRGLDTSDPAGKMMAQNLTNLKKGLVESMKGVFNQFESGSGKKVDEFMKEYATGPAKYQNDPNFRSIIQGQTYGISPQQLNASFQKGTQGKNPNFQSGHDIAKMAPEFKRKIDRSDLYKGTITGLSGLVSSMAGNNLFGPLGYGAGLLGAGAAHTFTPKIAETLLNDEIGLLLEAAAKKGFYSKPKNALIGERISKDRNKESK